MDDLLYTFPVLALASLVIVFLYCRFRRAGANVPWACHVTAAIGLTFGVLIGLAGVGHSVAVAALALREPEYGPLQVLRFTTGAMLVYFGAMNVALCRAINAAQRSAIAVSAATGLFMVLYLIFLLPLPGTGGAVPRVLALCSLYLLSLGTAAIAVMRRTANVRADMPG